MLNVFIVNRTAGGGKTVDRLIACIEGYFERSGGQFKIEYTERPGHATELVRDYAKDGGVRIFACGGDGTLHEAVCGAAGTSVELGAIPCGTGNDYVASYGEREHFLDIEAQVSGTAVPVDIIRAADTYAVNQCSMGFDAAVADNVGRFKGKRFISGSMAYILAIFRTVFRRLGYRLSITVDGGNPIEGEFMFAITAKGRYQGGGIMSAPSANPTSGNLNFMIVDKVNHFSFMKLLPKYMKGRHANLPIVRNLFGSTMTVEADRPLPITLDGEIIYAKKLVTEVMKGGLNFVLPAPIYSSLSDKNREPATV